MTKLDRYYVLAENVAEAVDILCWWFGVRLLYLDGIEAVVLQPVSVAAEKAFSMIFNMINKQQSSAPAEYEEAVLMRRCKGLQRQGELYKYVIVW